MYLGGFELSTDNHISVVSYTKYLKSKFETSYKLSVKLFVENIYEMLDPTKDRLFKTKSTL